MGKKVRYVWMILLCILNIGLMGGSVWAKEKGSISIRLEEDEYGTSKEGVEFAYTKIANIVNGDFVGGPYLEGIELEEAESAKEIQKIAEKLSKRIVEPDGTIMTDKKGVAFVDGLDAGVYLLTAAKQETDEDILPTILMMPSWDEKNKIMDYEVEVIPKRELIREDNPIAPQTNLDSDYVRKIISAGFCVLGVMLLLVFSGKKEKNE